MSDSRAPARPLVTPPGIKLCLAELVADGGARNIVVQLKGGRFHGFVVRRQTTLIGYVDRCPHAGLPLAHRLDDYLTPGGDLISCDWHGALFTVDDGLCIAGPCTGARLMPWPVTIVDDWIVTA